MEQLLYHEARSGAETSKAAHGMGHGTSLLQTSTKVALRSLLTEEGIPLTVSG